MRAAPGRAGPGRRTAPAGQRPHLPGLGQAEALRLSPDGVRAALVVDGPGGRASTSGPSSARRTARSTLRDLRAVAPSLSAGRGRHLGRQRELLVLAGNAAEDRIVPYPLGVDGWGLTAVPTAGLPGQPQSIGAAPTRQPLVNAAARSGSSPAAPG